MFRTQVFRQFLFVQKFEDLLVRFERSVVKACRRASICFLAFIRSGFARKFFFRNCFSSPLKTCLPSAESHMFLVQPFYASRSSFSSPAKTFIQPLIRSARLISVFVMRFRDQLPHLNRSYQRRRDSQCRLWLNLYTFSSSNELPPAPQIIKMTCSTAEKYYRPLELAFVRVVLTLSASQNCSFVARLLFSKETQMFRARLRH